MTGQSKVCRKPAPGPDCHLVPGPPPPSHSLIKRGGGPLAATCRGTQKIYFEVPVNMGGFYFSPLIALSHRRVTRPGFTHTPNTRKNEKSDFLHHRPFWAPPARRSILLTDVLFFVHDISGASGATECALRASLFPGGISVGWVPVKRIRWAPLRWDPPDPPPFPPGPIEPCACQESHPHLQAPECARKTRLPLHTDCSGAHPAGVPPPVSPPPNCPPPPPSGSVKPRPHAIPFASLSPFLPNRPLQIVFAHTLADPHCPPFPFPKCTTQMPRRGPQFARFFAADPYGVFASQPQNSPSPPRQSKPVPIPPRVTGDRPFCPLTGMSPLQR